jgi:hypothetical protein
MTEEVYEEEIIVTEELVEVPTENPTVGFAYGDLYLKFPDEATASQVLEGYEGSVDVIGIIYRVDNTDPENPIYTPEEGWHVNTRGPMNHILGAYSVEVPTNPRRVWA